MVRRIRNAEEIMKGGYDQTAFPGNQHEGVQGLFGNSRIDFPGGYEDGLIGIVKVEPSWTVLNLASRDHNLIFSLASRAKSVTTIDSSQEALRELSSRCRREKISNVRTVFHEPEKGSFPGLVGRHDVVIASHSIGPYHLLDSAIKLNSFAKRHVYICMAVGVEPTGRRAWEAIGRKFQPGPSYTYIYYNVLYERMGLLADINFIRSPLENGWPSHNDALESFRCMIPGMSAEEEERLRAHLEKELAWDSGEWVFPCERECRWAVISWATR